MKAFEMSYNDSYGDDRRGEGGYGGGGGGYGGGYGGGNEGGYGGGYNRPQVCPFILYDLRRSRRLSAYCSCCLPGTNFESYS